MPGGDRLTVGARRAHKGVEVFVRDSGEGVAPEALRRIFEPFYSGKEKGSGLGLAIVEKIVREHGGRIRAESRPGRGTAFRIELPV
jgi:signal transduction histidine kinase